MAIIMNVSGENHVQQYFEVAIIDLAPFDMLVIMKYNIERFGLLQLDDGPNTI